jgi:hypothetical protein
VPDNKVIPLNRDSFQEKHYRIAQLAELWGMGKEKVRLLVKDEPGVLKIPSRNMKTPRILYSVPESVVRRIHTRFTA